MLDKIDEIIKDLASDKDENGNVIAVYPEIIKWLSDQKVPQKHYIAKMQTLGIAGKKLLSDYNAWEKNYKESGQSFGNYVEFCFAREERKKSWENWMKGERFDVNNCR